MSDDLKKFADAIEARPEAKASKQAKDEAIGHAMAAFDKKFSPATQGSGALARLKDWATRLRESNLGRNSMTLNQSLAGGASLAVLLIAAGTVTYVSREAPRFGDDALPNLTDRLAKQEADAPGQNEAVAPIKGDSAKHKAAEQIAAKPTAEQRAEEFEADGARTRALRNDLTPPPPAATGGAMQNLSADFAAKSAAPSRKSISGLSRRRPDQPGPSAYRDQGRDRFAQFEESPVKLVTEAPVSTFSIDVDTASYGFVRAALNAGHLPQKAAVRVEEMINYFAYDYAGPKNAEVPFKPSMTLMPAPWNAKNQLLHIGIKGYELDRAQKPKSNLVFLIDSSGSMNAPNKLPLVKSSMRLLLESLGDDDTVAIVTYAGGAGTLLEPTKVKEKAKILSALDGLGAAGSTAGAEGIRQAYQLAEQGLTKGAVNRVILSTDGDFNVGITDREELKNYIERKRKSGIFLSVLGFGRGNYNDALMQTLAQNGNGTAAYIDTLNEARKVLVEEASSTLFNIARDVKIQVEFNPQAVSEYRLIGYETRSLKREDFNNDKVDAGDIGAGHRVTAIYEISPIGDGSRAIDALRYQSSEIQQGKSQAAGSDEIGFLKIRYKRPDESASNLISLPITSKDAQTKLEAADPEARFATSVAAFGQLLKGGKHTGGYGYDDVIALAQGAKGADPFGYRAEFINLVRMAKSAATLEPLAAPGQTLQKR